MENNDIKTGLINVGKKTAEIELLKFFQKIINENKGKTHFSYKKGIREDEWKIYLNDEYFHTIFTSIFKILPIMIDLVEIAYAKGRLDVINEVIKI